MLASTGLDWRAPVEKQCQMIRNTNVGLHMYVHALTCILKHAYAHIHAKICAHACAHIQTRKLKEKKVKDHTAQTEAKELEGARLTRFALLQEPIHPLDLTPPQDHH